MNQLELTVAEKLRLFDSLVGSVLNYNASVLGYHEAAKHIGLGNVWYEQRANNVNFQNIKQRILDIFKQSWYSNINNSSRLFHYSLHKQEFKIETYLICNIDKKYQCVLSKFRLYSNNVSIETGRYTNVERKDRLCIQCTMSMIEDDYHVLLVCPKYRHLRQKLFTPYFCKWPSLQKFTTLMSSSSPQTLLKLSKFLFLVFKERQT